MVSVKDGDTQVFYVEKELPNATGLALGEYKLTDSLTFKGEEEVVLERAKIASVKTVVDYDKLFSEQ